MKKKAPKYTPEEQLIRWIAAREPGGSVAKDIPVLYRGAGRLRKLEKMGVITYDGARWHLRYTVELPADGALRAAFEQRFAQIAPDLARACYDANAAPEIDPGDLRDFMHDGPEAHDPALNALWRSLSADKRSAFLRSVWPDGPAISLE